MQSKLALEEAGQYPAQIQGYCCATAEQEEWFLLTTGNVAAAAVGLLGAETILKLSQLHILLPV